MRRSRPSRTAAKVAWIVAFLGDDPVTAELLPQGMSEATRSLLKECVSFYGLQSGLLSTRLYRRFLHGFERRFSPGAFLYMATRKRWIHDQVCDALDHGVGQVVILGAGFDVRVRLLRDRAELSSLIEVDHPGMQAPKAKALERLGWLEPPLELLPVDFEHTTLSDELAKTSWQSDRPTLFLAEGLLMYLREAAVEALFRELAQLSAANSRVVLTTAQPDAKGRARAPGVLGALTDWSLRLTGEPFRWAIRPDQLGEFLGQLGWNLTDAPKAEDLRRRYSLDGRELMDWERLSMAVRA